LTYDDEQKKLTKIRLKSNQNSILAKHRVNLISTSSQGLTALDLVICFSPSFRFLHRIKI